MTPFMHTAKRSLKKLPLLGPALQSVWRNVVVPAQAAWLRTIPETAKTTTAFGRRFFYPSRSLIGRFVASGGEWDGDVLRQICPVLPSDAVIVEVGSNIGASTAVLGELLPQAQFLLVEPAGRYLPYLKRNTAHLGERRIGIETRALSDGHVPEVLLQTNSTTGTPSNVNYRSDLTSAGMVQTATLAQVCEGHGIERLDFLKVDTDGYEIEVFRGAESVIAQHAPLIFTEFCPTALRRLHHERELIALLSKLGCEMFVVFKHSGEWLGIARDLDGILALLGRDYYADLVCAAAHGKYAEALGRISGSMP